MAAQMCEPAFATSSSKTSCGSCSGVTTLSGDRPKLGAKSKLYLGGAGAGRGATGGTAGSVTGESGSEVSADGLVVPSEMGSSLRAASACAAGGGTSATCLGADWFGAAGEDLAGRFGWRAVFSKSSGLARLEMLGSRTLILFCFVFSVYLPVFGSKSLMSILFIPMRTRSSLSLNTLASASSVGLSNGTRT